MESSINLFEKIESYLANELNKEERKAFEEKMNSDVEFLNEVNLHRDLDNLLIDDASTTAFKNTLKEIDGKTKI